jgi:hypothetical protein
LRDEAPLFAVPAFLACCFLTTKSLALDLELAMLAVGVTSATDKTRSPITFNALFKFWWDMMISACFWIA